MTITTALILAGIAFFILLFIFVVLALTLAVAGCVYDEVEIDKKRLSSPLMTGLFTRPSPPS